ncbi:MAG: hypothetical protein ACJARE_002120 [Paracoccaceae bacterium]
MSFLLLAPTSFFLLIINITYALLETFGLINVTLKGELGNYYFYIFIYLYIMPSYEVMQSLLLPNT